MLAIGHLLFSPAAQCLTPLPLLSFSTAILEYIEPQPYALLFLRILKPLNRAFILLPSVKKARVILTFTRMLRRWLVIDWQAHWSALTKFYTKSKNSSTKESYDNGCTFSQGPQLEEQVDYYATLVEFVKFVDSMSSIALQSEDGETPDTNNAKGTSNAKSIDWYNHHDDVTLQYAILDFFEIVSQFHIRWKLPLVVAPSPAVVYRFVIGALFSFFNINLYAKCYGGFLGYFWLLMRWRYQELVEF